MTPKEAGDPTEMRPAIKPVAVVGMGMSPADLTERQRARIRQADVLVGGRRHLACFAELPVEKKEIRKNLKALAAYIREQAVDRNVVVLASGDPLYYGIGGYLVRILGTESVEIYPNVSAVAAAFARIREPWQDAAVVSLHGRSRAGGLGDTLQNADKVAVYTDPEHPPQQLAALCLELGCDDIRMCVLEQLGSAAERIRWLTPAAAVEMQFEQPNLVIFRRESPRISATPSAGLHLGMPETVYEHEHGLITKSEIRTVAIARLALQPGHVLWDLGAGSGSVGLEASLLLGSGRIVAVEKDPRRADQIEANRRRFGITNLAVICAALPDGLTGLPAPDRVFVGGGGSALIQILAAVDRRLRPGGMIVVNLVLIDRLQAAAAALEDRGYRVDTVQVQVNRSRPLAGGMRFEAENPVWILRAEKIEK